MCVLTTHLAAGYKALFLSVDVPVLGLRLNEYRNKFELPEDMGWPNILSKGKHDLGGRHDYGIVVFNEFVLHLELTHIQTPASSGKPPFHG